MSGDRITQVVVGSLGTALAIVALWYAVRTVVTGQPNRATRSWQRQDESLGVVAETVSRIIFSTGFAIASVWLLLDANLALGITGAALAVFGKALGAARELHVKRHRGDEMQLMRPSDTGR